MSDVEVKFGGNTSGLDAASNKAVEDIEAVSQAAKKAGGGFDSLNSTNRKVVQGLQLTGYQAQVLSYQMNDVFSGLLTGQKPFQVLMQQGPQITQIFGGLRGTLAALGAVFTPVVIGFTALAAVAAVGIGSFIAWERSQAQLTRSLEGAGTVAGTTVMQMNDMADAAAEAGDASVRASQKMMASFAQTGKIGSEMFADMIAVSKDYAYAMGMDAKEATEDLGAAMADPIQGAETLNDRMGLLNDTEMQLITTMVEQGRVGEAQRILLDKIAEATNGAADKAHGLAKAWDGVAGATSNAISKLGEYLALGGRGIVGILQAGGNIERGINNTAQAMVREERAARGAAAAARERAEANRASVAAGEAARSLLPKEQQVQRLNNQIALLRRVSAAGGIDAATATRAIAAAEKQISDLNKPSGSGRRGRSGTSAAERAAREALRVELATLDRQQAAVEDNLAEWNRVQDEKLEAIKKIHGEESVDYQRALEQKEEFGRKFEEKRVREAERAATELRRIEAARLQSVSRTNEMIAQTDAQLAQMQIDEQRAVLEQRVAAGELSAQEELAQRNRLTQEITNLEADSANRIYQIRVNALRAHLELEGLEVRERERILQELAALEAQHQQNLRVIRARGETDQRNNNRQVADQVRSTWQGNVSQMSDSFTSMFMQWGAGMQDFQTGWQNFGRSIYGVIERYVQNMVMKWVMGQLGMTTAATAGEAARTGATAAGAAARTAIGVGETVAAVAGEGTEVAATVAAEGAKTGATVVGASARVATEATAAAATTSITASTALAQIGARAASAAAGAYSAVAAIPVIGPFLAPVMAATALAGVLALGNRIFSAKNGVGAVANDGDMYELHKDEMVLPANIANPLRSSLTKGPGTLQADAAVAGESARSEVTNQTTNPAFTYAPNIDAKGRTAESLGDMLNKEGAAMRRWINNQVRSGKLKVV